MTHAEIRSSIADLTDMIVNVAEQYFSAMNVEFDRVAFCEEIMPVIEFTAETAHFSGADILSTIRSLDLETD